MHPLRRTHCALLFIAALALPQVIEAQELAKRLEANCTGSNVPARDLRVVIDANTGEVLDGSTRFPESDRLQVVLRNKNPFKYRYRVTVVSNPIDVGIVHSFMGMVPGLSDILKALQGQDPDRAGAAGAPAPNCDDAARTVMAEIEKQSKALESTRTSLGKTFKDFSTTFDRFLKATDREEIPAADCPAICRDAEELRGQLPGFIDGTHAKALTEFEAAIAKLQQTIADFKSRFPDCAKNEAELTGAAEKVLKTATADAKTLKEAMARITETKSTLQNTLEAINAAAATAYPFVQAYYPQVQGEPTAVTVTIWRTNLREASPKEHQIGQVVIQLGEARVSISAGFGFSNVRDQRLTRVPAMVPGEDGEDVLGARFGYSTSSRKKPVVLVMLNGHTPEWRIKNVPLYINALSVGVVFRAVDGGSIPAEIVGGISRRLGGGRFVLTLGMHAARIENLAGDPETGFFKLGDPVPAGLTDLETVKQKDWRFGAVFALTFKMR